MLVVVNKPLATNCNPLWLPRADSEPNFRCWSWTTASAGWGLQLSQQVHFFLNCQWTYANMIYRNEGMKPDLISIFLLPSSESLPYYSTISCEILISISSYILMHVILQFKLYCCIPPIANTQAYNKTRDATTSTLITSGVFTKNSSALAKRAAAICPLRWACLIHEERNEKSG